MIICNAFEQTMDMILIYILLIAYILAINFYSFLLVKTLRDKEREEEQRKRSLSPLSVISETATVSETANVSESVTEPSDGKIIKTNEVVVKNLPQKEKTEPVQRERSLGKLFISGALGGAITIYLSMFLLKFRRGDLLLMLTMPLLGVLNVYIWVLLFRSGFSFFLIR